MSTEQGQSGEGNQFLFGGSLGDPGENAVDKEMLKAGTQRMGGPTKFFLLVIHNVRNSQGAMVKIYFYFVTSRCLNFPYKFAWKSDKLTWFYSLGPLLLLACQLSAYPASWMAPQLWGPMIFVFYLEWLPGPGTRVHVQQPGILEQL